jgi:hypothetical protein
MDATMALSRLAAVLAFASTLGSGACSTDRGSPRPYAALAHVRLLKSILDEVASACGSYPRDLAQTTIPPLGATDACRELLSATGNSQLAVVHQESLPEWSLLQPEGGSDTLARYKYVYEALRPSDAGRFLAYRLRALPMEPRDPVIELDSLERHLTLGTQVERW